MSHKTFGAQLETPEYPRTLRKAVLGLIRCVSWKDVMSIWENASFGDSANAFRENAMAPEDCFKYYM